MKISSNKKMKNNIFLNFFFCLSLLICAETELNIKYYNVTEFCVEINNSKNCYNS